MKESNTLINGAFRTLKLLGTAPQTIVSEGIRRAVIGHLRHVSYGTITFKDGRFSEAFGTQSPEQPAATIKVHKQSFYERVAFGGSVGAAEAFMDEDWTTDDLTTLVRLFVRNRDMLNGMEGGLAIVTRPALKLYHGMNKNKLEGSRRNIAAHYDLSNDFFSLFLDPSMTYSAGIYPYEGASLLSASLNKIDRLCQKLDLKASDHLLEIGSGWGAMALFAASNYGCKVTTVTISEKQLDAVQKAIKQFGLEDRITVLFQDYRKIEGQFDKIVSVEMIEAVGHHFFDTYFAKCASLLKPDGLFAFQAITIQDQFYEEAKRSVDFIQRYIFPGSTIPSITALMQSVTLSSDMKMVHMEDITPHYATTLKAWHDAFMNRTDEVKALGFDDRFIRMWQYYLCYCEGGFIERVIGDVQIVLSKPLARQAPILGTLKSHKEL